MLKIPISDRTLAAIKLGIYSTYCVIVLLITIKMLSVLCCNLLVIGTAGFAFVAIFLMTFFLFQLLNDLDKWGVDMFKIAEYSNNRPLTCVTYKIFQVRFQQSTSCVL